MKRYTFVDGLPVQGSEAQLVTAAIAASYPKRLSELARDAGISKFAASRAAEGLITSGILSAGPDGYVFDDEHPLAPVLTDLAWRFSGVRRPTEPRWPAAPVSPDGPDDYHYRRWIPESLTPENLESWAGGAGPSLQDVRESLTWMDWTVRRLRDYERVAGEVCQWWGTERLRDMVHQTLHLGDALDAAHGLLTAAAGPDAQGEDEPGQAHVPGLVWARATYLASAELRNLLQVIRTLDIAIRVGGRVNHRQRDALYHLEQVNTVGRSGEFADQWIQEALDAAAQARALWVDDSYGRYKHVGTPRVEDVGTAGDLILAVQLHGDATDLAARVRSMATHPSIEWWRAEHPDQARTTPLVHAVPADVLHDARQLGQMPIPQPGAGPLAQRFKN